MVSENIDKVVALVKNVAASPVHWGMHPEVWEEVNTPFDTFDWDNTTDTTTSTLLHDQDLV